MRYLNVWIALNLITVTSIAATQAEDIDDIETPEDDLAPPSLMEDSLTENDFDVYPQQRSARSDNDDDHCHSFYSFRLTKRKGTFREARIMCRKDGGDLLHENFGFAGKKSELFYAISQAVKAKKYAWVGLERRDRRWQFIDRSAYNPQLKVKQLFQWGSSSPSENGGDCAIERSKSKRMKNVDCNRSYYGVCEYKRTVCLYN